MVLCILVISLEVIKLIANVVDTIKDAELSVKNMEKEAKESYERIINDTKTLISRLKDDADMDNIKTRKKLIEEVEEENKKVLEEQTQIAKNEATSMKLAIESKMDDIANQVLSKII